MNNHKYILEPYKGPKTRHTCPQCGYKHRFTRYINTDTNEYISDKVGRCDRENNCNYHYTPSSFFTDNPACNTVTSRNSVTVVTNLTNVPNVTPVTFIPFNIFEWSMRRYRQSCLFPFLSKLFTAPEADRLCEDYFIGANKDNHTVFWQVDINGNVRQAKVMQYDSITGKRNKQTGAFFAGKKILNNNEANLNQCFFGEYQLADQKTKDQPVAIVESEKTAVIASIYFPEFTWLATGGKYGCKWTENRVCSVLKGRRVILFPDLGAFEAWKVKAGLLASVAQCQVVVSDILEKAATENERADGLDIADYLLQNTDSSGLALKDGQYPAIWDYPY